MREFGWTIPVLLDELGEIIAGHGRVLAAPLLGWMEGPVMIARGWSEAQKRAYRIAEPFLGTSTLIAANSLHRVCLGLEIEPRYVDICIKRWQQLTGRGAPLEGCAETINSRLTNGDPGPEAEAQLSSGD